MVMKYHRIMPLASRFSQTKLMTIEQVVDYNKNGIGIDYRNH